MSNEILLFLTPPISKEKDISYLVIFNNAKVFPTLSTKKKWEGEGAWSYVQSAYEKKRIATTVQSFSSIQKRSSEIFHLLLFYNIFVSTM